MFVILIVLIADYCQIFIIFYFVHPTLTLFLLLCYLETTHPEGWILIPFLDQCQRVGYCLDAEPDNVFLFFSFFLKLIIRYLTKTLRHRCLRIIRKIAYSFGFQMFAKCVLIAITVKINNRTKIIDKKRFNDIMAGL